MQEPRTIPTDTLEPSESNPLCTPRGFSSKRKKQIHKNYVNLDPLQSNSEEHVKCHIYYHR